VTATEWLASRIPAPPERLRERMLDAVLATSAAEAKVSAEVFADAGKFLLDELNQRGCNERSSAVDLLAADALFTYAIEISATSPEAISSAADYALKRIVQG
jgi:hypothetical protein